MFLLISLLFVNILVLFIFSTSLFVPIRFLLLGELSSALLLFSLTFLLKFNLIDTLVYVKTLVTFLSLASIEAAIFLIIVKELSLSQLEVGRFVK